MQTICHNIYNNNNKITSHKIKTFSSRNYKVKSKIFKFRIRITLKLPQFPLGRKDLS